MGCSLGEGPGLSAAECRPSLPPGVLRAPLCPCARWDQQWQQQPFYEPQWGTASPIPHVGKQAEDERPRNAFLTQLSLQELFSAL